MKKILITGENSYIGNKFEEWVKQWPDKYEVDKISLRGNEWKKHDFSIYNSVLHIAGIAHVSSNPKLKNKYFHVNRDLTINVAQKAKEEKVEQFLFLSSMIVFGKPKNGVITKDTLPNPTSFYGQSKLEAETGLKELETETFKVAVIRPPMVYGENSKGNYPKLAKLARVTPIFPDYPNKRSMLFIDNLSNFLKVIIDTEERGTFHPQNKEYIQTSDLVQEIGKIHNHKVYLTKLFNPVIKILSDFELVNKIFGNLYYEQQDNSLNHGNYQLKTFKESIRISEKIKM